MERENLDLRYWRKREFALEDAEGNLVDHWPKMSLRQLVLMDVFRYRLGLRCRVSPVPGALARYLGRGSTTQHNVDRWHECRASDILPDRLRDAEDGRHAVEIAQRCGFTGIGIYPHWRPMPGLHLDCRKDVQPGDPALWAGIDNAQGKQIYVSLEQGLEAFDE